MTKYILSIDGGGIRGIIPAMILSGIEKKRVNLFLKFLIYWWVLQLVVLL
ncbi:MAG: hypothetical protein PG981_001504 [Wolbachia endosymbiont of Ctenocephalides orientis wCori]|nr:MAG: hypothetical protein PG981_000223 [Wolbachia endosymbiont of Ctenocephalides orientis wCori]WCR53222.1 MAG: hypothetical protein PG981_000244 [Wolbachia endosymbiont of Ctenocephalides orientis wCori]WCR53361.1 MAG: hypothetical protein PG981_000383 [Wolbachia endosymbiont of Ctenocephalides orientis wCori]WCR53421.1 MAG: hypothetical protein PG981_000443 [Wolbachia endosymbiont of Ctenocephalides orientis wCori]WCR53437.1 MAG: hypothetical protein PG981_000459 [Wolbachia endosymbiont o